MQRSIFITMTMPKQKVECLKLKPSRRRMHTEHSMKKRKSSTMIKNIFRRPCCRGGINFASRGASLNSAPSYPGAKELVVCGLLVSVILFDTFFYDSYNIPIGIPIYFLSSQSFSSYLLLDFELTIISQRLTL